MKKLSAQHSWRFAKACLVLILVTAAAVAQSSADYDGLVQQGKVQLQSGNNDAALSSANAAIKLNADRWEAYAVAGGALMNLKRNEEAADDFSLSIQHAPDSKKEGLRALRRQCLTSQTALGPQATSKPDSNTQSGPPLQEILAWLAANMPSQVDLPFRNPRIDVEAQEIAFQGCTATFTDTYVKYHNEDRPPNKRAVSTTVIDLTKLSPDAATVSPNGPAVLLHSDRGFSMHIKDWIKSSDAIMRHESEPDQLSEDDEQPTVFGYYAHDNDLAKRMVHAWHDAISKCAAKAVPTNLY